MKHIPRTTMTLLDTIINGICTGLGNAIGSYLAITYAIKHLKKVDKHAKKTTTLLKRFGVRP